MDYPNRRRIKVWGTAEFVEGDPELLTRVSDEDYPGQGERVLLFHVKAWDVNCRQHITPRFTADEVAPEIAGLRRQIGKLKAENRELRQAAKRLAAPT